MITNMIIIITIIKCDDKPDSNNFLKNEYLVRDGIVILVGGMGTNTCVFITININTG